MFKAKKIESFGFFGRPDTLGETEFVLMPSNIRSMQVKNKNQTIVRVKNVKGLRIKDFLLIEKSLDSIYNEIIALDGKNIGDFKIPLDSTSFGAIPYIALKRENDGTTHKSFCMVCGFTKQIYHSQKCGCRIKPKFEGKLTGNKISKQAVCINMDSGLDLKYNRFDENWTERTVFDVTFDDTGMAIGKVKVKDKFVEVTSDDFLNKLSETKGSWHTS